MKAGEEPAVQVQVQDNPQQGESPMAMEQVNLQELQRLNDAINLTFEAIRRVAPQLQALQQSAWMQAPLGVGFGLGQQVQNPWQQNPWQQNPWQQLGGGVFGMSPWQQQISPFAQHLGQLGQIGFGQLGFGGAGQYGIPQYGIPQYGIPQYGIPQYGVPQYGIPQYGISQQLGVPQYGIPQYGIPQQFGMPHQLGQHPFAGMNQTPFQGSPFGQRSF